MANPNIVNVTSIYGKVDGHALTTDAISASGSNVITCGADQLYKINSIIVANIDGTDAVDIDVAVNLASDARFYLAKTAVSYTHLTLPTICSV